VLRAEREALQLRRTTVVGHAVTELSRLSGSLDTDLREVGEALEKYTGHPEPAVQRAWIKLDQVCVNDAPCPPLTSHGAAIMLQ
jgi:hypothetical protein